MSDIQSPGNRLERIAFQYCKIATFSLLAGRYALPAAAMLSAVLFVSAHFRGKHDTRCYFKRPLIAAGFWLIVFVVWLYLHPHASHLPEVARWWF